MTTAVRDATILTQTFSLAHSRKNTFTGTPSFFAPKARSMN